MQEEVWKNGKLWNVSVVTLIDGKIKEPGNFKNGAGTKLNYYPDGNLEISCNFKSGQPHGKWKYYYESGELAEEGIFDTGYKTGQWITFHKNGNKESEGRYLNDVKIGTWKFFSRSGTLIRSEIN